ncbi:DUF4124 domain-containing protein [uncultured Aquitalea sp.]|uniref:DUF4124 domain-containing protein n=1 Tax=uncultured Aquitalea sp. TaxID=540272 RepID=UPI0025ED2D2D|nr:DUF4124 domain-containing protein [uncultured Aquitalea sp.]
MKKLWLILFWPMLAHAADVYKCRHPQGALVYQDQPCVAPHAQESMSDGLLSVVACEPDRCQPKAAAKGKTAQAASRHSERPAAVQRRWLAQCRRDRAAWLRLSRSESKTIRLHSRLAALAQGLQDKGCP